MYEKNKMIVLGLTGNIASGKSTIANFVKKKGIPVHDSDKIVNRFYKKPTKEFIEVVRKLKIKKAIKKNKINKNYLRKGVFSNKRKLKSLEEYLHLKVEQSREFFLNKQNKKNKKIVLLDIPLLFEKKLQHLCDFIIVAYAPKKHRILRATKRKNITKEIFEKIIKFQKTDSFKTKRADYIIYTNTEKKHTFLQVNKMLYDIKRRVRRK